MTSWIALDILLTMLSGVPLGMATDDHVASTTSSPLSLKVGIDGKLLTRSASETPSGITFPASICGRMTGM